jgi:hypothetical protein
MWGRCGTGRERGWLSSDERRAIRERIDAFALREREREREQ